MDTCVTERLLVDDSKSSISRVKWGDAIRSYAHTGILSRLTFSWMTPLLALGRKRTLELNDIPQVNSINTVYQALPVLRNKLICLERNSNSNNHNADTSRITGFILAKALFLSAWKEITWTAFLAVIYAITSFVCPYLIDNFVQRLNGRGKFNKEGYILVSTFCVANLVQSLLIRHLKFKLEQVGMRFRTATSALIYNKGLRLSSQSKQNQTSGGELLNLVAVDVEIIDKFTASLHDSWLIILQVILGLLIIFKGLGIVACFGALVATAMVMLSNSVISTWEETYQDKLMESKDKRMKMTSEVLRNMRLLKLQGWDSSFLSLIFRIREVESQWLKKYMYTSALMNFVINMATTFVGLITFGLCILIGIPLETGKILSALATISVLEGPIVRLPVVISLLIQVKVSLRRIAAFLCLDEHQVDSFENIPLGATDTAIEIIQGNFTWDTSLPSLTLQNISLKVSCGMKVAVCGTVGSGKSSLLSCILGEIPKISGDIKLSGTKAFVAQTPWIQSGTIRDNILFGKEVDIERYDKVLKACALNKDLENLSFGDQTIIGERGVNLSGGQKQRIQIARALYHDADIYLLDDPFSAVDAHTGSHLYKEVLLGLLRQKTVVYVTHQVEFSTEADLVLVMKDGRIARCGKYDNIFAPGCDFTELVGAQNAAMSPQLDTSPASDNETQVKSSDTPDTNIKVVPEEGSTEVNVETSLTAGQLIQEEEKESGSVGFRVYWIYITMAYAGGLALLILIAQILLEIFRVGSNYWLAWASPVSKDVKSAVSGFTLMTVYVSLAAGIALSTLLVDMSVATIGYTTATILFRKMHERIFRAPMSFFDATPSGRILNRCSADQSSVETRIPSLLEGFTSSVICLLTIASLMCTLAWEVLIVFIPVVFACIWYQRFYIPSSRELSRLKAVYRAPVIQVFAETMSGTTTIRSFGLQSKFKTTYMNVLDAYCRPHFHAAAALKWLMLRIDAFSSITFAFLLVLLVSFDGQVDPAIAGIAVTYALRLNNELLGLVWNSSYCETEMISAERILQYLSIPSEAPLIIEANRPDNTWPSSGEICADNLHVRYAPHMPLVLQGITCTFPGKMKTGIVGRTGSGKSTLVQALFRIVEPTKGRILIDGIDIALIGLQDLRSKLAIIPQDPIMFQGTIRSNLDPLAQFTDMQLWETLDKCQLGDEVRKMEKKLDSDVIENGENWSMGQRQLVCLGRVLLKRSKVLVLDEATASVDTATDNLIQQTLNTHFSHSTIITIAHRMTSVLDSDMVLLLKNGVVEEFDTPTRLLQNNSSSFAKLVAACTSNGGGTTNSRFRR